MSELREYIITLINFEDLDDFYEDMETPGGNLYIPNRAIDVVHRREISRNTHYLLTDEEAEQIRQDPRVLAVELTPKDKGAIIKPLWTDNSNFWDKSSGNSNTHKNWALLRCIEGLQRNNWGSDGTATQTGTVQINAEGRNVDVVIMDGFIDPNHPEFAVNADGTGGSRVVQYNWLQHATPSGTYQYGPYTGANNQHGIHVAGTVAGNTQGWARKANIYNMYVYGGDINPVNEDYFDYVRLWHNNKPINQTTGRKNPTIVNNSWGYEYTTNFDISSITKITFRGVEYTSGLTSAFLTSCGLLNDGVYLYAIPFVSPSIEADQEMAIDDGIIIVGAAGNNSLKIDIDGGQDYNNSFTWGGSTFFYHRGMSPTRGNQAICVGAISTLANESKATYSSCGPRIDVYAPGSRIISAMVGTGVSDSRNSSYFLLKYSGTSMASPQVSGVLACILETYPTMNQNQALDYLIKTAKQNQITEVGSSFSDYAFLQGSPNRYLYFNKERQDSGTTWPKLNYKPRPSSGRLYPRQRVRR
jgi:subtilisin family serine protease